MEFKNLYVAEVMSNDDTTEAFYSPGQNELRVKIYIEPIMKGWNTEDYPWARPFQGGGSLSHGSLNIPETGDKIWVVCENPELLKNWYYLSGVALKNLTVMQKVKIFLNGKFKLSRGSTGTGMGLSSKYPDVKLTYYKNGVVIGVSSNSSTPEIFIYHPEGSFINIDKEGKIFSKGDWKHFGNFEATKEVTAMTATEATKVTLSKHIHASSIPGPSVPATPGV